MLNESESEMRRRFWFTPWRRSLARGCCSYSLFFRLLVLKASDGTVR